MLKLIEFALLCSCSKHNNSICRNNKIQKYSQKKLHVKNIQVRTKFLECDFYDLLNVFSVIFLS